MAEMSSSSNPNIGPHPLEPSHPQYRPLDCDRLALAVPTDRDKSPTPLSQRTPDSGQHVANHAGDTPLLSENVPAQERIQVEDYFGSSQGPQDAVHGEDSRQDDESALTDILVDIPKDQLIPILPPTGFAALDFRPMVLRPAVGIACMVLYLVVGASIGILYWRSINSNGEKLRVSDQNVQLIARYLPTTTGTVTFLLFQTTCTEAIRMMPYINMADQRNTIGKGSSARQSVAGMFYPWRALWPLGFTPFSFITCVSSISLLVIPWLVAAKSTLLAVVPVDNYWEITILPEPAAGLIFCYLAMFFFTASIILWFWSKQTGLRWDPVSIADTIALFASCNAMTEFAPLELEPKTPAAKAESLRLRRFRIGYWRLKTANSPEEKVVYGVGSMKYDDKGKARQSVLDEHRSVPVECEENHQNCEHYPYQINPGYSRFSLGFWITLAYICCIGCFYALASGHIVRGFQVRDIFGITNSGKGEFVEAGTKSDAPVGWAIFVMVFNAPTVLGGYLYFYLELIDHNMRQMQPFVSMFENAGSASNTILLEYPSASPILVPLTAWNNGHYKVFWFSTLHSISPLFQIFLSSLVFPDKVVGDRIHFKFTLAAFIGTFTFLLLYCVSLPLAWPNVHRLFPRQINSMGDLLALSHQSHFLLSEDLKITDPTTTREHMVARIFLHESKYLFGVYEGRDGRPHTGFDVVETKEDGLVPGNVEWIAPTRSRRHRVGWYYFGRGRSRRKDRNKANDTEMGSLRRRAYSQVGAQADDAGPDARSSAVDASTVRRG